MIKIAKYALRSATLALACTLSLSASATTTGEKTMSKHKPPRDFSAVQAEELRNELPGRVTPYFTKNDEGDRYLVGGMVLNVSARAQDTGGQYEIMTWTGGKGAGLPLHHMKLSHQAFYIIEGQVEFWLDGKHYMMTAGDYANVPAEVDFAFKLRAHRTKLLNWSTGSDAFTANAALGTPFKGYVQPEHIESTLSNQALTRSNATGNVVWKGNPPEGTPQHVLATQLPKHEGAYVLAAGEGERYVTGDQMFTYLGDAASTNGRFIALLTEGPAGGMIPAHFHALHTEVFYPLQGNLTMRGNSQTMVVQPGDVVHIPAGTIHAYQMNNHYTKFIGFLTPAVFDNFFRTLGDAYEPYVFPQNPGPLHFERVMKKINELDIYMADDNG